MNHSHDAGRYSLVIEWSDADQVYIATVPELPGCRTHGATRAEALQHGEEVAAEWLDLAAELGWAIPDPRKFDGHPHGLTGSVAPLPEAMSTR